MESVLSYIVIIGLIIVSVFIYNIRKKQSRIYLLSAQNYPELKLSINIEKKEGEINAILLKIIPVLDIELKDAKVELISSKREFNYYSLAHYYSNSNSFNTMYANSEEQIRIPFDEFKTLLKDGEHPFRTFRFVVYAKNDKPFKSHELGFNKKWIIYRPDSGSYN